MENRRGLLHAGERVILIPDGTHESEKIQRLLNQFGIEYAIADAPVERWEERPMVIWESGRYGGFDRISELAQRLQEEVDKELRQEHREKRRLRRRRRKPEKAIE